MRVVVAGGRDFNDYPKMKQTLDHLFKNLKKEKLVIISGAARGADTLGERYAKENNIECERFPADWDRLGNAAGPVRNRQMAETAHACVVFWDGKSRGTANMIDNAKAFNLKLRVINY